MKRYTPVPVWIVLLIIGLFVGCTDDSDDNIEIFDGVHLFDDNGNPLGCYGPCADDWGEIELTSEELTHILLLPDHIDLAAPQGAYMFQSVKPFPIPIRHDGDMFISVGCNQEVKFKMAIVSNKGIRLAFLTEKVTQQNQTIALDDVFFANVPLGEIVRMYYGYFDNNDSALYTGYGDLAVCRESYDGSDYKDCFE
jgi:hypothetical protein